MVLWFWKRSHSFDETLTTKPRLIPISHTLTQQSLKTNSHIQLVDKRLIDPSDDHIPFKIPASKKTSEELFITVQSSLMRNFLVSCNPLRDTHLITNDLMEDTATNYEQSPYSNDDLLIKCFDSFTQSAPQEKNSHVTICLLLTRLRTLTKSPSNTKHTWSINFPIPPIPLKENKKYRKN